MISHFAREYSQMRTTRAGVTMGEGECCSLAGSTINSFTNSQPAARTIPLCFISNSNQIGCINYPGRPKLQLPAFQSDCNVSPTDTLIKAYFVKCIASANRVLE